MVEVSTSIEEELIIQTWEGFLEEVTAQQGSEG